MRRPRLGPLAEREFRLLFLGRTVSFVGSSFGIIALAFAVLDLTGSKADLGYVLAARTVPMVAFLLVGGIWADRLPRHHVMVGSNLLSGASQAAVAALLFSGQAQIWQLAALAAVNGTSSAFFFPASSGIVPQTVPERLLQQANALLRLGLNGSAILGGAVAGFVVYATSPATGIAIDAATFFAAAALLAAMRLPRSLHMESSNFLADLALGWREFTGRAWLWAVCSYDALGSFALIPLGLAVAGPVAEVAGTRATLFAGGLISLTATLAVLLVSEVRNLRRRGPLVPHEPAVEAAV